MKEKIYELVVCEYINDCEVPKLRQCWDEPKRCTIYRRNKTLERGRKHFLDGEMFIGS